MAAYFRRRAGGGGGPLSDDPYPALLVSGSAAVAAGGETGGHHLGGPSSASAAVRDFEKVYEFPVPAAEFEPGDDVDDDVVDCCPRHYQMALVDAAAGQRPPSLETFRPAGGTAVSAAVSVGGLNECCPLVSAQQRYGTAATAAVLRLHDRRR